MSADLIAKLQELKQLMEHGFLSPEEFDRKRQELIDQRLGTSPSGAPSGPSSAFL